MTGLVRGREGEGRGGGRANVCLSELDFSPASVSLLATLWLNYLQSTSNIFKLNFIYAQSCIFPLFLRYETALRSTRALFREEPARRVCSVFVLRADIHDRVHRQSLHRNCYFSSPLPPLSLSLPPPSLSPFSSFLLRLRQIRIDIVFVISQRHI